MSEILGTTPDSDGRLSRIVKFFGNSIWADVCDRLGITLDGDEALADKVPTTERKRRIKSDPESVPRYTLQVENDVGGPTSVYQGSTAGISRNVQIAENYSRAYALVPV